MVARATEWPQIVWSLCGSVEGVNRSKKLNELARDVRVIASPSHSIAGILPADFDTCSTVGRMPSRVSLGHTSSQHWNSATANGAETRSVFSRYNIVDSGDLHEAMSRLHTCKNSGAVI
jgi:hypothetical protein